MLANGTKIGISATETKVIQDLQVGDMILAAGLTRDWKATRLEFSMGTPPGSPSQSVRLQIEGERELIGSPDQAVLTDRGLVAMSKVVPGDNLIQADGQSAVIQASIFFIFNGGEHIVATSIEPTTDPEGHLIVAQGFIVADYALNVDLLRGTQLTSTEEIDSAPASA